MLGSQLTNLQSRFSGEPQSNNERIIRAAAELFTSHGYEGTSTDAIAKRAGVKPPALYREFKSKEDILSKVLESVYEGFLLDMDLAIAGINDPAQQLARLAWAHTWTQLTIGIASAPTMFSVGQLLPSLSEDRAARLRALARAYGDKMTAVVEAGVQAGLFVVPSARSAAFSIATVSEYSPLWFRPGRAITAEQVAHDHAMYALRIVDFRSDPLDEFVTEAIAATSTAELDNAAVVKA